jgi:hypothetical protein
MGESKLRRVRNGEMPRSCAGVQTAAGRVQVRGESESAATPMGSWPISDLDRPVVAAAGELPVDLCEPQCPERG